MKRLIVLVILLSSGLVVAQEYTFTSGENSSRYLVQKSQTGFSTVKLPGQRMRNAGRALTICGGALAIGGIIMMNNADELYYTSTQSQYGTVNEGDPKGALGVLMTIGGVGMIVPGVILWSKGQKKYNRYLERQGLSLHSRGSGLALRYSLR